MVNKKKLLHKIKFGTLINYYYLINLKLYIEIKFPH